MSYIISDSFKKVLRDMSTPILVAANFYRGDSLCSVSYYSLFPFELDNFLSHFSLNPRYSSVSFYGIIPPSAGSLCETYHIVSL